MVLWNECLCPLKIPRTELLLRRHHQRKKPRPSEEGPFITTASAEVLLALEATRSLTGVSVHLAEEPPHIHKDLEWDCHHVQQSETSSWPACYYCGA